MTQTISKHNSGTQTDEVPALATLSQVRQGDIDAMSFKELDQFVNDGISCLATNDVSKKAALKAMRPAILRVHEALSCQGRRTDLLDAPEKLTFNAWVKNKEYLGSRATIYRLLADAGVPQKKPLAEGATVKDDSSGEAGVVTHVHEVDGGVPKVDVLFDGEKKAVTCDAEELVKVTVRRIAVGDLIVFKDKKDVEYRYEGGGKLVLAAAPLNAGQAKACRTAKTCRTTKTCTTKRACRTTKSAAAGQRI
ncbi:MAG: hypothetical protein ABSE40_19320 [Candidatus Sulfotelmatobacter sp.]